MPAWQIANRKPSSNSHQLPAKAFHDAALKRLTAGRSAVMSNASLPLSCCCNNWAYWVSSGSWEPAIIAAKSSHTTVIARCCTEAGRSSQRSSVTNWQTLNKPLENSDVMGIQVEDRKSVV